LWINDILDFSKIEAGKLDMERIEFNLRHNLDDAVRAVSICAHQKGLELTYDILPEVPEALLGDPTRLRQIVFNLVGNAVKFTAQGEVILRVEREELTGEDVILHFSVADTGVGIPLAKRRSIFEGFTRRQRTMSASGHGCLCGQAAIGQRTFRRYRQSSDLACTGVHRS
jgi:signal transduction histidine kinase